MAPEDSLEDDAESDWEKDLRKPGIRSYVIREGRMTPGQKRAIEERWAQFGLDIANGRLDLQTVFSNSKPTTLEIGFGMGDSLFDMALSQQNRNFIGCEVHRPGVGHLLGLAAEAGLKNLRVFNNDSIDVLTHCIADHALDTIQIFFPDPWHKKKHHKRRLINPAFAKLLAQKLKSRGIVHIATDWADYAEGIEEVFAEWGSASVPSRPQTKYERRGLRLNHEVFDFAFTPSSLN